MLLKFMLPQGNAVPETVYEAKQIICLLGLEVEKIHTCKNDCTTMIDRKCPIITTIDISQGLRTWGNMRNALFVDSTNSIIGKIAVMMRTTIETEEKVGLKRCFDTFLSFLV
jgi:hypothetical protein